MTKNKTLSKGNSRKIVLKKDWLLQEIFPSLKDNKSFKKNAEILKVLMEEYAIPPILPKIVFDGDIIIVQINDIEIKNQEKLYQQIVRNAEEGNFAEAKNILGRIIDKGTTYSDFFRIYGQILSKEGNRKEAITHLKIALKWDPNNTDALVMLGNIYSRDLKNHHKAEKLYNKGLSISPNQHWILNNLGNCQFQLGKLDMALESFDKAIRINPNHSNPHYNKAQAYLQKKSYLKSFDSALVANKVGLNEEHVKERAPILLLSISGEYMNSVNQRNLYKEFHAELEKMTGRKIIFKGNKNIGLTARLEVAEYKNLKSHIIHFNPSNPDYSYQIMHELMHLYLINDARIVGNNKLSCSSHDHLKSFLNRCQPFGKRSNKKFIKIGISPDELIELWVNFFCTICLQIFNTPIDLFIDQIFFDNYPDLRPIQFHALFRLMEELLKSIIDKRIIKVAPPFIRKANIILIYIQIFQFRDLYGVDLTDMINLSKSKQRAEELYKDYLQMRDRRRPGEEYELVEKWAKNLYLDNFFDLIPEEDMQKRKN